MESNPNSARAANEKYVVALELGSSQAKIGVAGFDPADANHTLTVYNAATLPTVDSVRYGRINNIREVTETVTSLLEAVEKQHPIEDRKILGVYISIGGLSMKSRQIKARQVLPGRREITEDLIERLREDAIDSMSTADELICVEPVRFHVDNMPNPRPVGSLGTRLAGEFTAVVCNPSNKNDIIDVVADRVGLSIAGVSVRPLALAHLILSASETNAGCMLVDFGAETITVSIYKKYALRYLVTIPLGSRLITRDLSATMALTEEEAEDLKIKMANALPDKADDSDEPSKLRETVNAVVQARLADIVANIAAQPEFAGFKPEDLPAGIILTGGGAKLRNFARLLESNTRMKVRIATLPPDIIITDSSLSATDNLDLIALLNEGAEASRTNPEVECLTPPAETRADEDEEVAQQEEYDSGSVAIDFMADRDADTALTERQRELEEWGYLPGDFGNENPFEPKGVDMGTTDRDSEEYGDDEFSMMDDDDAERKREQKARRLREQAEKARREEAKRAKEEKRRRDREERRRAAEGQPSRIETIISKLTGLLSANYEDRSADLDD